MKIQKLYLDGAILTISNLPYTFILSINCFIKIMIKLLLMILRLLLLFPPYLYHQYYCIVFVF